MDETEPILTTIDAATGEVNLCLSMDLEWFDLMRSGIVGVCWLVPHPDQSGAWGIKYRQSPPVTAAHVEEAKHALEEEEGDE